MIRWKKSPKGIQRSGSTLPDVLITLGIIGMLLALLLPAIQQARAKSQTVQCRDHLRQLGVATQHYLSAHADAFPQTSTNGSDPQGQTMLPSVSPHRGLLDFLDLSNLSDDMEIDSALVNDISTPPSFSAESLQKMQSLQIPVFLCPSDTQRPGATNYRANMGFGPGVYGPGPPALNGYIGNVSGAFVHGKVTRPSQFRDGLSNTMMYCEKLIGDGDSSSFSARRDFFFTPGPIYSADDAVQSCGSLSQSDPPHASHHGWTWIFGGWNSTWYNHILPPNSRVSDCSVGGNAVAGGGPGAYSARSFHQGGVNGVLADGSSRFFSNEIDLSVWRSLSSRDSQELP